MMMTSQRNTNASIMMMIAAVIALKANLAVLQGNTWLEMIHLLQMINLWFQ